MNERYAMNPNSKVFVKALAVFALVILSSLGYFGSRAWYCRVPFGLDGIKMISPDDGMFFVTEAMRPCWERSVAYQENGVRLIYFRDDDISAVITLHKNDARTAGIVVKLVTGRKCIRSFGGSLPVGKYDEIANALYSKGFWEVQRKKSMVALGVRDSIFIEASRDGVYGNWKTRGPDQLRDIVMAILLTGELKDFVRLWREECGVANL